MRILAEADAADAKLAHVRPRPTAEAAPVVAARLELGSTLRFVNQRFLRHRVSPLWLRVCPGRLPGAADPGHAAGQRPLDHYSQTSQD